MAAKQKKIMSDDTRPIVIFLVLAVFIILIFGWANSAFLSIRNLYTLLKHVSINGICALGLTFVIAAGHVDMAFPRIGCLAGMTSSHLIAIGQGPLLSILAGVAVGVLFGLVNGIAIGKYNMPDMVVTIGTGFIAYGLGYIYSGGARIFKNFLKSGILDLNNAKYIGLPLPVIITAILYLLGYLILHRSTYGRGFYATGEHKVAAIFSGVKVRNYIIVAFVLVGGLSAFATILITSAQGTGIVKTGLPLLMPAYSAVFLGSAIFKKPTVYGTILGALFISVIINGFVILSVPYYYADLIMATILIVALTLSSDLSLKKRFKRNASHLPSSGQEMAQ